MTSRDEAAISYSTRTDAVGRFRFFAPPGRYSVSAYDYNVSRPFQIGAPDWGGESLTVEIVADQFADAAMKMRDLNSKTHP